MGFEKQHVTALDWGKACICGIDMWQWTKNALSIQVDHNFAGESGMWPDHQSFAVDVVGVFVEKACFHLFADHIDPALAVEPFECVLKGASLVCRGESKAAWFGDASHHPAILFLKQDANGLFPEQRTVEVN